MSSSRSISHHALAAGDVASRDLAPPSDYYVAHSAPPPDTIPLNDRIACDVLVVGAGITGLSTALHLGMRGIRSVVVDSNCIGWGASSRNFGSVVPYLKNGPDDVMSRLGPKIGERVIEDTGRGPDLVFGLIERYGIECAASRAGLLFALHSERHRGGLEARTHLWQQRGAPVELLDKTATRALLGSDYYALSALDRRGGSINPVGYVHGLARAAISLGASIYTDTPVIQIEKVGGAWSASTPHGTVAAKSVVFATNGYTPRGLWAGLRDSIIPMRAYQVISAPLAQAAKLLPIGLSLTDTRHLFSGLRMHPDGCLQAGLDGPAFTLHGQAALHKALQRVREVYPQLEQLRWRYSWSGWIAMTHDQIPHLHELAPGVWAGLGYSGRGVAHSTMMGRDLAALVDLGAKADPSFPVTPLQPRLSSRFARPLVGSLLHYYRIVDGVNERRRSTES